jgi:hypothetical protein
MAASDAGHYTAGSPYLATQTLLVSASLGLNIRFVCKIEA